MDPIQFEWSTPEEGHRWVEATKPNASDLSAPDEPVGQCLVENASPRRRVYQPLKLPKLLCSRFAAIEPSPEEIMEFANEFGRLGAPVAQTVKSNSRFMQGESFLAWRDQIRRMRRALDIWQAVKERDLDALETHIVWREGEVYYQSHLHLLKKKRPPSDARWTSIASQELQPELFSSLQEGDVFVPAQLWLQSEVNQGLKGGAWSRLLWESEGFSSLGLFIVPRSLIAALWLQLAQAISGNRELRSCPACEEWFEITPEKARTNRLYCSDACKSRAFRNRQRAKLAE